MIVFVVLGVDTQPGLLFPFKNRSAVPFSQQNTRVLSHQTNTDDFHGPQLLVDNLAVQRECGKTPSIPAGEPQQRLICAQ